MCVCIASYYMQWAYISTLSSNSHFFFILNCCCILGARNATPISSLSSFFLSPSSLPLSLPSFYPSISPPILPTFCSSIWVCLTGTKSSLREDDSSSWFSAFRTWTVGNYNIFFQYPLHSEDEYITESSKNVHLGNIFGLTNTAFVIPESYYHLYWCST